MADDDKLDPPTGGEETNPPQSGEGTTDSGSVSAGSGNALAAQLRLEQTARKKLEKELETFRSREQERENAKLSEAELLKKQIADLEGEKGKLSTELLSTRKRHEFERLAQGAGCVDCDLAFLAADLSDVEHDGEKFVGLDAKVETLKAAKPLLFGQPKPADFGGGGVVADSNTKVLTQKDLESMSHDEVLKIKPDVEAGRILIK